MGIVLYNVLVSSASYVPAALCGEGTTIAAPEGKYAVRDGRFVADAVPELLRVGGTCDVCGAKCSGEFVMVRGRVYCFLHVPMRWFLGDDGDV